jgi:dihydrodipicolinate synthase/N-acetylneuraminate lyase
MTLQLDWLRGCATALVTPFTSSGAVDEQRLRELIEYQINGGVRLLVPCGTTGESVTMTDAENQLVISTTVELARERAKVIAGTGSNSTAVTIARSQAARELGVDAVLTVAPYYNKPRKDSTHTSARLRKRSTVCRWCSTTFRAERRQTFPPTRRCVSLATWKTSSP